jgi:hypothetical protein
MRKIHAAILSVVLFVACPGPAADSTIGSRAVLHSGETWLVTSLQGQRIGYSVSRFDEYEDGYRFENLMKLDIAMMGVNQKVRARSVTTTNQDLALRDVSFTFEGQGRSMRATAEVRGKELVIQPADGQPRLLELDGPVYPADAIGRLVVTRKLEPGAGLKVRVFDATTMSVDDIEVQVVARERVVAGDREYDALKVQTRLSMFTVTTWLDADGLTIVEEAPPGMRSERADPQVAASGETGQGQLDLLRMFRVKVDTLVPDPTALRRVRLELKGVTGDEFEFAADNQQVISQDPLVLEIVAASVPDSSPGLPFSEPAEFLASTMTVQSDDVRLGRVAREIVGPQADAVDAARALVRWVYESMNKVPTASFPTALDVLQHMEGDCNEHAVLLAGLARSVGLPARTAVGLVYMDGAFYYHAWNEVFVGQWLPVDATFGEFPAGVLHLRLSGGDLREQSRILTVVGRFSIRLLEFE